MTTSFETFLLLSPEITLFLAALIAYLAAAFSGLRAGWLVAVTGLGIAILQQSASKPQSLLHFGEPPGGHGLRQARRCPHLREA
jgi:hypothetical protein